jgi:murein DD-endopeptidase MepM/ murein hydrolase activator NlpD
MKKTLECRPTIMPVKSRAIWITSRFGWRKGPFTGLREFHKGLDISGRKGTPIIASAGGVVVKVGYNRFKGKFVKIQHDDRFTTVYGHLMKYIVKKKQKVDRGEVIGYMGTTGMSTGYHLHYVVIDNNKKVNPYNFILNRNEHRLALSR